LYSLFDDPRFRNHRFNRPWPVLMPDELYAPYEPVLSCAQRLWNSGSSAKVLNMCCLHSFGARDIPESDFHLRIFSILGETSRLSFLFRAILDRYRSTIRAASLSNLLFLELGLESPDQEHISDLAQLLHQRQSVEFSLTHAQQVGALKSTHAPNLSRPMAAKRKPTLVLISADFRDHPVGRFILPLLRQLVNTFTVVCIYVAPEHALGDHLTAELRAHACDWYQVDFASADQLEQLLRSIDADLAIDLGGHTADNQPRWLQSRLAKVQASYLGFYGPTYAVSCDWWIIDQYISPYIRHSYPTAESQWCLPFPSLCYDLAAHALPDLSGLSLVRSEHGMIGSFNHTRKLSSQSVGRFAGVLNALPSSSLVLRSHSFADPELRRWFLQKFLDAGVRPHQLLTLPFAPTGSESLRDYARIQLHLDTYPVSGTTTTLDSLAMGVPVLTCPNHLYAGAISAALLESMGLHHCVVHDPAELPTRAAELLKRYRTPESRRELARHVRSSLVFNTTELPRLFAEQLTEMLKQASMKAAD